MSQDNSLARWSTIGNIILIGGSAFCILVLFYFFYHYSLSGERQFIAPIGMASYYGLPAVLATLLLAGLRLERNHKINLAILLISFGVSLIVAELFLTYSDRISNGTRPIWGDEIKKRKYEVLALAKEFGVNFDTRSRLEVLNDLRAKNIEAFPAVNPTGLLKEQDGGGLKSELDIDGVEILPLAGVSNRLTVFCNETGTYSIYDSDEHGFHNPRGIWQSSRIPIVALGDSFAAGGCVASDKGFVALIRNRYPGTLNLAMAGEGALSMLATLREYATVVKPKIVLWFYYEEGDIDELHREAQSRLLLRYLQSGFNQNLLNRQTAIDKALVKYIERSLVEERGKAQEKSADEIAVTAQVISIAKLGTLRQKLGLIAGTSKSVPTDSSSSISESDLSLFRSILLEAKATVASWGGTLYFVYLPAWQRYGSPHLASRTGRYRDRVLSTMKQLEVPTIDIQSVFHARSDPLSFFSFRRFGHYNENGHRVVAEEVLKSLAGKR